MQLQFEKWRDLLQCKKNNMLMFVCEKNYLGKTLRIEMLIYPTLPPLIPLLWETDSYKVL